MSAFTNMLLLATAIGGSYYVFEVRPAKKRKLAKKKQAPAPAPAPELPPCPPGGVYNADTGACEPLPSPEPAPGPGPLPPPPGPEGSLAPPPSPGKILMPASTDIALLHETLTNVPTVLIVPFSDSSVWNKVLPYLAELAVTYPELQFVELPTGDLLGPMDSNVVLLEVGVQYLNGAQEGTSMFLAEGNNARQQMAQANETIDPTFTATDIDVMNMNVALPKIVAPIEEFAIRARAQG